MDFRPNVSCLVRLVLLLSLSQIAHATAGKKPYIVYMGPHIHDADDDMIADSKIATKDAHYDLLASFVGGKESAKEAMIHSCTNYINAFGAKLDADEAAEITKHPDVISVFPNKMIPFHTTHSWNFLGLERRDGRALPHSLWTKSSFGRDVIIANVDSGVWPESQSFNDQGMGPVPSRWKGGCQNNTKEGVLCNRKLIGAKYFNNGPLSQNVPLDSSYFTPRDLDSHGTHTLSTAGGDFVSGVNFFGQANGTAKGGAPSARVASYKVLWDPVQQVINGSAYEIDVLAAIDEAIRDGVDVLSISAGQLVVDFFDDALSIGAFHATRRGIPVVVAAGNLGPKLGNVLNIAPWLFTIGASTTDRDFISTITLGNGHVIKGKGMSAGKLPANKLFPLIRGEDAGSSNSTKNTSQHCGLGSLDPKKAEGKIVVCLRGGGAAIDEKEESVKKAGGVGMIHANYMDSLTREGLTIAEPHELPSSHISYANALVLYNYMDKTTSPVGTINDSFTEYGVKPSPKMAMFSSRGPNVINPEILKPDVIAPGFNIMAAISQVDGDSNRPYQIFHGTSMACPHVAGVVGLLKGLYPDWSPAMLKSALMTTATTRDNTGNPIREEFLEPTSPFAYGAGHIRPNRAMDPGLVYDLTVEDYLDFMCYLGHNASQMSLFSTNASYSCPKVPVRAEDLNYPSITIPHIKGMHTVRRTLKNVGKPARYSVRVKEPQGFQVKVTPKHLSFKNVGEEGQFKVTVRAMKGRDNKEYQFGELVWSDGKHRVTSQLVLKSA